MKLDEIIELCRQIEAGVEGQKLGFHLHYSLREACAGHWPTNDSYPSTFSGFLKALQEGEWERS